MIRAKPSLWAKKVFHIYVMRLMKRHFYAFYLLGEIPIIDSSLPLILIPNHSTWWDGFFVYLLNVKIFNRPVYLMMLERQLSKYQFFARVGAYSIEPTNPKSVLMSLKYTVNLLEQINNPPPMICFFPQGELLPWAKRPLNFKRGIDWIIEKYNKTINLLPLAIRVEHLEEQQPEVFFLFGKNYSLDANNFLGVNWLQQVEEELLGDLNYQIIHRVKRITLLEGRRSVNVKMDRFLKRNRKQ